MRSKSKSNCRSKSKRELSQQQKDLFQRQELQSQQPLQIHEQKQQGSKVVVMGPGPNDETFTKQPQTQKGTTLDDPTMMSQNVAQS